MTPNAFFVFGKKNFFHDFSFFPRVFQTAWVSSPKESVFPETIPEEASSVEEERVVIFRIPYATCKPSFYTVFLVYLKIFYFPR